MGTKLKQLLTHKKLVTVFGMGQLCGPKIVDIVAQLGYFDAVWFDREHAGLSTSQIEQASLAARAAGIDSFVRVAPTDYQAVMQPLEAGAGGLMFSQISSADETERAVRWAKFHPEGIRGVNGTGADGRFGSLPMRQYFAKANEETFIAVQIENTAAVEDVERIAAVPNIDILFIGPADLSQSLGIPGEWENPRLWQAIERVAKVAAAHRVPWAILSLDLPFAKRCVGLGCRMLSIGFDVWAFQRGLKEYQKEYGGLGIESGIPLK